jgi:cytochrome c biogenesis protein CcmG/thiol:disulfide interchange protein DsbE
MRRSAVPVLLGLLGLALVALLIYAMARPGTGEDERDTLDAQVLAGKVVPAPDADRALPRLGAPGELRLADLRGKVVVLNVWGSWCVPCRREAPLLERTHRALAKAGVGTVLGVTNRDTPEDSLAFARDQGMTFPSVRDPGSRLANAYGAIQVPETFVIDAEGRIRAFDRGETSIDFLRRALKLARVPDAALPAR